MRVQCLFPLLVYILLEVEANIQGELCTDISIYTPVQWHEGDICCKQGIGKPSCTLKPTKVCVTHQETKCRIVVKDMVEMKDCPILTSMIGRKPHEFQPWDVDPEPFEITHTKYNFTCENKTREICDTVWVTDLSGIKTAEKGACEEVVWLDCWKTPYNATFTTIRHVKKPLPPIKYSSCFNMTVEVMQMCFHVKKVAVSECVTVPRPDCTPAEEKWCEPQLGPEPDCVPAGDIPWQKRIHKEKCLQPGESSSDGKGSHHGEHHAEHNGDDHHKGVTSDRRGREEKETSLSQPGTENKSPEDNSLATRLRKLRRTGKQKN